MSALGELASTAAGAVSGGIWKIVSIVLLVLMLVVGGGTGVGWWLAAHDRDVFKVDLAAERKISEDLRTGIREQNRATEALGKAREDAEARGLAAQQLATANGRRFDAALAKAGQAHATTCAEAMPTVNSILEAVR